MNRLTDKVALISGAARGLGAEFARELAAEGACVVIGDVLDEDGSQLAEDIGPSARFVHLDVRNYDEWSGAVKEAEREFGRLDILVNNAGVVRSAPIDEHTLDDWNLVIDINLTGSFHGIRAAATALKASGRGSIINISSDAGLQGYGGITGYNASKFGLRGLTKSAAIDLGPYNVRVNTVHPGLISTPLLQGMKFPQDHVALHRMGEMSEIAKLVVFLASDESSFSTGAEFVADGGESAGLAHAAS
ncbi:SDR family oxidoreductase [Arthrobacter sp. Rue61a]|uniref:SDR family oxidoreductase n=1 Tax=Arthrobacter sp. Rue61a TaxID=1118963 RepID=UPI00027DFDAF|nr:SDR family oxidoreductase [Arthrobacter sp. Rue61a]AFR28775.1 3-alpha-(or 20-beta)-hydroxysteroid dehydrogenase FabG [Arthrobacter sp. Rue61a]